MSATPQINKVSDLLGYLNFLWNDDWQLPARAPDDDNHPEIVYTDEYHEKFAKDFPVQYALWDDKPLFCLDPQRFAKMLNKGTFQGTTARTILKCINNLLQLRRTMPSKIQINDTESVMIGSQVKPYRITAVELGWGSHTLTERAMNVFDKYIPCLNIPGAAAKGGENKRRPESDVAGLRNARVHRQLAMCANDPRYDEVVQRCPEPKKKKYNKDNEEIEELMPASEIYRMMASDDCGGNEWLSYARDLPLMPLPTERLEKAKALAAGEPKQLYIAKAL